MRPKFPKTAVLAGFLALLQGCSSAPTVNKNWMARNCGDFPRFTADACHRWSNCRSAGGTLCQCSQPDGGRYEGELLDGKYHGWGKYIWPNGTTYAGYWTNNVKACGVEANSAEYFVYRAGVVADRGSSTLWADTFAAALVIGAAGYAASKSGGAGGGVGYTTDYDWDWDFQPGNNQWVCRGIQTGQYAPLENCRNDIQDDDRWPG